VEDSLASKLRHLMSVRSFERREAAHIKRLKKVGGVRWHAERDNLVLRTELIKLWCSVAAMAVKDEESVYSWWTRLCISVEMLYPLIPKSIVCPAIVTHSDSPVRWEVLIPAGLVELAREDYERWDTPPWRVDTLDRCYPLTIAWLNDSRPTNCVWAGDYFWRWGDTHHEASLIKVECILISYPVRDACVLYQLEPGPDPDRIFTASPLWVEFPIPLCLKLWLALDKAWHPLLAKRWRRRILAAASEENVSHPSYVDDVGRKSTSIKVKDPLHERLLLDRA
jgi:hypothetical protein